MEAPCLCKTPFSGLERCSVRPWRDFCCSKVEGVLIGDWRSQHYTTWPLWGGVVLCMALKTSETLEISVHSLPLKSLILLVSTGPVAKSYLVLAQR